MFKEILQTDFNVFFFNRFDPSTITVRLGEYTFDRTSDSAHQDFRSARIKLHEEYNRETYVNDMALITLDRATVFNDDIWPVCLPPENDLFEGKTATVTG